MEYKKGLESPFLFTVILYSLQSCNHFGFDIKSVNVILIHSLAANVSILIVDTNIEYDIIKLNTFILLYVFIFSIWKRDLL